MHAIATAFKYRKIYEQTGSITQIMKHESKCIERDYGWQTGVQYWWTVCAGGKESIIIRHELAVRKSPLDVNGAFLCIFASAKTHPFAHIKKHRPQPRRTLGYKKIDVCRTHVYYYLWSGRQWVNLPSANTGKLSRMPRRFGAFRTKPRVRFEPDKKFLSFESTVPPK